MGVVGEGVSSVNNVDNANNNNNCDGGSASNNNNNNNHDNLWHSFSTDAGAFVKATEHFTHEGVNPGGYYKAVWCRDASYILKDWFLSGRFEEVMHEILFIWSHQLVSNGEKVIYGRGSPEMQYSSQVANIETHKKFEGALPSTIFHGFSEVYGKDPDIDSTALMISTTAWIFDSYLKSGMVFPSSLSSSYVQGNTELKMSTLVSRPSIVMDYVVPRMLKAVEYLSSRDIDGDNLLEQGHNEDWMDTVLRSGKIVYSQACWILALSNLSSLLLQLGNKDKADEMISKANMTIKAVEEKLWSEKDGLYIDLLHEDNGTQPRQKALTQDIALYLVAVTENTTRDVLSRRAKGKSDQEHGKADSFHADRAERALDSLRARIWKDKWPLVTESALERTGPWVLDPNQYHNHTFWPWTTGVEMLARSRFARVHECHALLSMLTSEDNQSNTRAFYEWVNPVTNLGSGAHPFRTGISAIRIAIADILCQMGNSKNNENLAPL